MTRRPSFLESLTDWLEDVASCMPRLIEAGAVTIFFSIPVCVAAFLAWKLVCSVVGGEACQ